MKKPRISMAATISRTGEGRAAANQALPPNSGARYRPGQVVTLPVSAIDWDNLEFNFKEEGGETRELMKESLENVGQLSPIHVYWEDEAGKAVVVNGFTRAAQIRKLAEAGKAKGIQATVLDPAVGKLVLLKFRAHANLQEKYTPSEWWKLVQMAAPLLQARHGRITRELLAKEFPLGKSLAQVLAKALGDQEYAKRLSSGKHGVRDLLSISAGRAPSRSEGNGSSRQPSWFQAKADPKKVRLKLVIQVRNREELKKALKDGPRQFVSVVREFAGKVDGLKSGG